MKGIPSVFICLDDQIVSFLINRAEKTIILASPSVSQRIGETIVRRRDEKPNLMVRVIVDANARTLRLGFGDFAGLKMLYDAGIDIRCQTDLLIGALIVDDRSWIFSPTPKIILDDPSGEARNAISVTPSLTKWLMFAMAPHECLIDQARDEVAGRDASGNYVTELFPNDEGGDEILDEPLLDEQVSPAGDPDPPEFNPDLLIPQIGAESLTSEHLTEIEESIEESPPKQFDRTREILVYNGFLQFVEMRFLGGRLSAKTVRIPDSLLDLVDDPSARVEIRASCRLFEHIDWICPEIKDLEKKFNQVRQRLT